MLASEIIWSSLGSNPKFRPTRCVQNLVAFHGVTSWLFKPTIVDTNDDGPYSSTQFFSDSNKIDASFTNPNYKYVILALTVDKYASNFLHSYRVISYFHCWSWMTERYWWSVWARWRIGSSACMSMDRELTHGYSTLTRQVVAYP